jgi:GAF domain-containing protein
MPNMITCPTCGKEVSTEATHCPFCNIQLSITNPGGPVVPEILVHRLGEYLVENKVIRPEDLEHALEFQKQEEPRRKILLGQALIDLRILDRDTLDRAITMQLNTLQKALVQANQQLEQRVQQRTQDLERRIVQIRTAADITTLALSASGLSELLQRTVELLVERFDYYHAAIFLVDESGQSASLQVASGNTGKELVEKGFKLSAGSSSMVGWVLEYKLPRVSGNVSQEPYYQKHERLTETISEATIPIIIGSRLVGVLDVQHTVENAFDVNVVAVLQTIANHIASVMQNYRLLDTAQTSLNELSALYQASYQLARASTTDEVIRIAGATLKQGGHLAVLFMPEHNAMRKVSLHEPGLFGWGMKEKPVVYPDLVQVTPGELEKLFAPGSAHLVAPIPEAGSSEYPELLIGPLRQAGYQVFALFPSRRTGKLDVLFLLAKRERQIFPQNTLQSVASLAELTSTALDKVNTAQNMEKRLNALQSLNAISQAVSVETDLMALYQVVHREVINVIGNVNFAIATYDAASDTIHVPYLFDGKDVREVERFPAGEGLTSILIRTRQPLMLVDDTERKTRELGAKMVGKPAKSWLGVPLLVAGEAIGAIILQDLEHEGRFDEDDQRLLTTLASQVAVAIRNARMLETTYRQAARERRLYEITNKIRNVHDMQGILRLTAQELSQSLGSRRAVIEIGVDENEIRPSAPERIGHAKPEQQLSGQNLGTE